MIFQNEPQQNLIFLSNHQFTLILQNKKGAGAQGIVYQGFNKNNNEQVAIKFVKQLNDMEAQILEQIKLNKLKNIIRIDAVEKFNNEIIIVMELAEMDFYNFMKTNQFLTTDVDERNQLFFQMIYGVQQFQSLGYYHRDLKPENFVICRDQNQQLIIKLIDFGLSKYTQQQDAVQTVNVGTPYYMSPEVINNESYSKAVDVWALGLIWYETLTTKTFFQGNNWFQISQQICNIQQIQIDQKIDQLNVQNEQKQIMKEMICIDKKKRISLDNAIIKMNEFFKWQENQKVELEIKKKLDEQLKQIEQDQQTRFLDYQKKIEQEAENNIEQLKKQLKQECDQKIEQKEKELKKIIEEQQPLINQKNLDELRLQQELQFQKQLNELKTQYEVDYQQKMNQQIQQIQIQMRESLEKKKQIADSEIRKKKKEQEDKIQQQIEINKKLQEQKIQVENQQKKEYFNIRKQNYKDIINLLKDTIQNSIFILNQKKQTINQLQLQNQDSILNQIKKFINVKEQELSQINEDDYSLNIQDENIQFSKFQELINKYKNQVQIHIEENKMIEQEINQFMALQFKRQEQIVREEKQIQDQILNEQEKLNQKQNYEILKNQYEQMQQQILNIKTICENYSNYNQNINDQFIRLKQNSQQIAQKSNQIEQKYKSLELNFNKDLINLIKLEQQEIRDQLQRLQENIISINQSITIYEEELKNLMQSELKQIQDKAEEIQYKINDFKNNYSQNYQNVLTDLEKKQEFMNKLVQQLNELFKNKISDSINKFMQIKQAYADEEQIIRNLLEKLQQNLQKMTKIKLMSRFYNEFFQEIQSQQQSYQQKMGALINEINNIIEICKKLENKDILLLLNQKQSEINELSKQSEKRFNELLIKSKQNQESQQTLLQLKEEFNIILQDLEKKKNEQMKQIMNLQNMLDQTLKFEIDQNLKNINQKISLLIQDFNEKKIEFNFNIDDYSYQNMIEQQKKKSEQLEEQKNKIKKYQKIQQENQKVTEQEIEKSKQTSSFQKQKDIYRQQLLKIDIQSKKSFQDLNQIKDMSEQYSKHINFQDIETQDLVQKKWVETKKQVEQLTQDLYQFNNEIKNAQKSNNYQIINLQTQFENLNKKIQDVIKLIPQKENIDKFKKLFDNHNKSFVITCSLIIILKAYNNKRYISRISDYLEKQKQNQQQKIQELNQQIQNNTENLKQNQMKLNKLKEKKPIFAEKVLQQHQFQVQEIMEKYKSFLKDKDFVYQKNEYDEDEQKMDKLSLDVQPYINSLNSVKIRAKIKDQQFNKEFSGQYCDQLEFCKTIVSLKGFQLFKNVVAK